MQCVLHWPLRDALLCYLRLMQDRAAESYQWARIEYLLRAARPGSKPGKPPALPSILKDRTRGDT